LIINFPFRNLTTCTIELWLFRQWIVTLYDMYENNVVSYACSSYQINGFSLL
jgi:hypothetical protein